ARRHHLRAPLVVPRVVWHTRRHRDRDVVVRLGRAEVIDGANAHGGGGGGPHHILVDRRRDEERAVGRVDGRESAHLAAARIGDPRLDPQAVVVAVLVDLDWYREIGLPVRVETGGAFERLLLAAPPVVAALLRLFVAPPQRRVVRLPVRDPGDAATCDRLAEVVA